MQKDLRKRAEAAKDKLAALGEDINLSKYNHQTEHHASIDDLRDLEPSLQQTVIEAGLDIDEDEKAGSYLHLDNSLICSRSKVSGLEVLGIETALEKYNGLSDYFWKAVPVDSDKYTALTELQPTGGYFIRAEKRLQVTYPLQSCLVINSPKIAQRVHNIVIVEEEAHLHIITGCASGDHVREGLHVGVSEFFIHKNASLTFTMIHNWAEEIQVRPRSVAIVEEGGVFTSNYVAMRPVKSLQMYPLTKLIGERASARYNSVLYAQPGSKMDVGGRVILSAPNTRAEVLSRALSNGGTIIARGYLIGEAPRIKAHLRCDGLLLSEAGIIHAIPELEARHPDVEMSHEAAVGRVAEEQIEYLMVRGLTEEEATALIVRGFLDISIEGIRKELKQEIERVITSSNGF